MPDWCANVLAIRGRKGVLACLDAIKGDAVEEGDITVIDFQKIVPMPAILETVEQGSRCDHGRVLLGDDAIGREMLCYDWVKQEGITDLDGLRTYIREHEPEVEEIGRRSLEAEQETGYRDWWDWRVGKTPSERGHWGTKWNACYSSVADNTNDTKAVLSFWTAGSPPEPVIMELSKQFPSLKFTLKYREGGNAFHGILRAKAGEVLRRARYCP